MTRKTSLTVSACVLAGIAAVSLSADESLAGRGNGPIIYVVSQGLCYDSIVTADPVPQSGPFQMLNPNHPMGLATMLGPGDVGCVGGR